LKFSFYEKATKNWSKRQIKWKITPNICDLLRKAELYHKNLLFFFRNFDFENERPIDGGRYEWQTSPYPKPISLKNRLSAAQENVENLHPASASASSVSGASVSGSATSDSLAGTSISENISSNPSVENSNSSKHTSPTPSDEQICDQPENPDLSGNNPDLKSSSSSSSSDSNQGPSSPSNQRKSSRPINRK
jgi:hypothetical protein